MRAATKATRGSDRESVVDGLVTQIQSLINDNGLTVGDQLPTERELCEAFGASRNTVREAMRILKAYGIVEVRQKVGATIVDNRVRSAMDMFSFNVSEISRKTFSDIQTFRVLIEVGSVDEIFDRITGEDIAELRSINGRLADASSMEDASEVDFQFHARLVAVLRNKAILDVYGLMKPVILRIMMNGKTRRTFETETLGEHAAVLDALESHDRLAYQYRLKTHLEAGYVHFNKVEDAKAAESEKDG